MQRLLPSNSEAERGVLGSLLIEKDGDGARHRLIFSGKRISPAMPIKLQDAAILTL